MLGRAWRPWSGAVRQRSRAPRRRSASGTRWSTQHITLTWTKMHSFGYRERNLKLLIYSGVFFVCVCVGGCLVLMCFNEYIFKYDICLFVLFFSGSSRSRASSACPVSVSPSPPRRVLQTMDRRCPGAELSASRTSQAYTGPITGPHTDS